MFKNRRVIFFALLMPAFFSHVMFAQNSVSLETEIQNLEREAGRQGISPVERHGVLVRLAQLRQLSGDIEGAARNWLEAAGAVSGAVDDDALLSCAYCLAAIGEWDRASAALEPLLFKSTRARFLELCIRAIRTGDTTALTLLAANPEYSSLKSEIYFMLWKLSRGEAAELWRRQLAAEFPQSIEGRLAAGGNTQEVIVRPSPFWLFMGGLDSLLETAAASSPAPLTETAAAREPAPAPPSDIVDTSLVRLQTGIFSQRTNAQTQVNSLRQAGFASVIEERTIGSNIMWAVTVPAGADVNVTIRDLQSAGFESFPIR